MSLLGSAHPRGVGTLAGRVPVLRLAWVGSGCQLPLSGEEESQGLERAGGLCDRWDLCVASDSGLKSKPRCRKDWHLTCPVQGCS